MSKKTLYLLSQFTRKMLRNEGWLKCNNLYFHRLFQGQCMMWSNFSTFDFLLLHTVVYLTAGFQVRSKQKPFFFYIFYVENWKDVFKNCNCIFGRMKK